MAATEVGKRVHFKDNPPDDLGTVLEVAREAVGFIEIGDLRIKWDLDDEEDWYGPDMVTFIE